MKKRQFVILILLLIIGFASVTTTLVLNGKVGVGVELDDFDVIFIESLLDGREDKKATISEDKKTITFSTDKLINVGDSSRLDYKVKNTSTQYNADVEINCTNEANEYVNVTSSFDGNQIPLISPINIKAQEVKSGYINAELIKAYAGEDTSIEIKCTINVTATSRETYAYSLMFNSNGGSSIDDKSVVLNEEYGELEEPIREGYTFLGWYDEEDNKVDETTILDRKGNKNLNAKWKYICPLEVGKEWTFDYTGEEQEFVIPCDGEYKLETWGAQGGSTYGYGGYGSYSVGKVYLNLDNSIYINVGNRPVGIENSYNEGTNGILNSTWNWQMSGGGGATHIAKVSGLLYLFENQKEQVIIVAGAGAGGAVYESVNIQGGHAGGISGSAGTYRKQNDKFPVLYIAQGGTQTSGGIHAGYDGNTFGTFGRGTTGGSGWYGGGSASTTTGCVYTGGGGSSYIGNPLLTDKAMYCYNCQTSNAESTKTISTTCTSSMPTVNCAKQGNGYAKITLVTIK